MKLLDGTEVAEYIKQRHIKQVAALERPPKLVIIQNSTTEASAKYVAAKVRYGRDIGVDVVVHKSKSYDLLADINSFCYRKDTTGLIVQLPLIEPKLTDAAIYAIAAKKDIDGLTLHSPFEAATPKAIIWLLAAYNIELKDKQIAVVGQGRLVGKPVSERLEKSDCSVIRLDIDTSNFEDSLKSADIIVSATGQPALITSAMVKPNAIIVDAGSPKSELAQDLLDRTDITRTPNPGGVGPMTVAALFDNLLIAAGA